MTRDAFERLVEDVLDRFPADLVPFFENVAITVRSRPTPEIQRKYGSTLLGLYEGVPQIAREGRDALYPDRITLFQGMLERVSRSLTELREEIATTLWHEIGHHLGFNDAKLHRIERRILRRLT